jgi:hypothetical protein
MGAMQVAHHALYLTSKHRADAAHVVFAQVLTRILGGHRRNVSHNHRHPIAVSQSSYFTSLLAADLRTTDSKGHEGTPLHLSPAPFASHRTTIPPPLITQKTMCASNVGIYNYGGR